MSKFTPTPAEVAVVNQIFAQADTQKLGVITGDAAVKIFNGAKLSPAVLAEIWSIADEDNNGVLTRKGVAVAVRLLGHAQRGEAVTEALVNKPGPIPTIEGITPSLAPQTTGASIPRSPPPGLPPLTSQDKAKFTRIFVNCGPTNGILSGDKARDVFVKSKLPVDKLSQIWNLADTKNRGALDSTDFTIAMYLIQACMSGQLQNVPPVLPPGVYEQAGGKSVLDGVAVHATGGSASFSPSVSSAFGGRPASSIEPHFTGQGSPLQPQMTGQARPSAAPPLPARSALSNATSAFSFVQPQATGAAPQLPWDVTPAEKTSADAFFDTLDTQKKGYIEGDVAVPFMMQSKLPEDVLAQIWDLSDFNNDGRLTRDGFAVAMHLIQGKINGKDVPTACPPTLVPPSMRKPTAAPAAPPPQPSAHDALRDLIWDDSPPVSATPSLPQQPALQPQSTGTVALRQTPIMSPPPQRPQTTNSPFATTSSPFAVPAPPAPVHHDLLGDDEETAPAASPPLQDKSAEIGNVKNQLSSTNRSLETAKAERENIDRALTEQAAQLAALQTQLSSAKAAYETETRLLSTLRERYTTQTAEIQKAREELIRGESDLSAVRVEKAEIEGAFLRDKEEVRELQRKMTEVGMHAETLKVEIEKVKKEAKQQRGLHAIAKKQLATREAEKAKVEKELEDAQQELAAATKEREEAEAELAKEASSPVLNGRPRAASPDILAMAIAQPLPATPDIPTSPTGSVMSLGKSNNPFERATMASGPGSRSQSPFLPFTNSAVLPTPPTAPAEATTEASAPAGNPFRFSDVFATQGPEAASDTLSVPAPQPSQPSPVELMSPTDTEMFSTPLSTANARPHSPAQQELGGEAAGLGLETQTETPFGETQQQEQASNEGKSNEDETALDLQLKELDINESDSESESEDEETLANVKARLSQDMSETKANGTAETSTAPAVSAFDDSFGVSTPTVDTHSSTPSQPPIFADSHSQSPDHDPSLDVFDAPFVPGPAQQPSSGPAPTTNNVFDAPFNPTLSQEPFGVPAPAANGNGHVEVTPGVNDFDEAMGKIAASPKSSTSNGTAAQFSSFGFDSAFDDNFDFAAATAATPSAPAVNGASYAEPAAVPQGNAFDDIFMSQTGASAPQTGPATSQPQAFSTASPFGQPAPQPTAQATQPLSFDDAFGAGPDVGTSPLGPSGSNGTSHGIAFDDAFGGHQSALKLDTAFAPSSQPLVNEPTQPQGQTPFPSNSPPMSPTGTGPSSPPPASRRSISPQRQMSPPPRHSSPKPRPSTSSTEREKVPTARHSKLSIRLPFGRKKKTHDVPPPMPPPLSAQQVAEEPTPAVDDDIEAVKQLCDMGFSRTQAVTALENHGYDVQRALNSLIGEYAA
ncbi:hypothetical protein WOLCODRAFT_115893 [Wolfiporia cocos MD-104 SS10]|uniref:Uncharacterized protein n=1 Tax=Wolfiporia cocos (strain MD-104) TaxID=742152 RepID=A0A2H3J903_WOLCO|nr:hypothetical protein WOLCODRAFT_115893 [Wolfiporia cocos MD-104 SS10]